MSKVFLAVFHGEWMGGEAVVFAKDEKEAIETLFEDPEFTKLNRQLKRGPEDIHLQEIKRNQKVFIISDGDY